MTEKGKRRPQTPDEWEHLADLYENALMREKEENSKLRAAFNRTKQKYEATLKRLAK